MTAETDANKTKSRAESKEETRAAPLVPAGTATQSAARVRKKVRFKHRQDGEASAVMFGIGKGLSPLQAHDLVTQGLPVDKARELMESFHYIDRDTVLKTMGISERTLQRARSADKPLDSNASDRSLRLASVTEQAIEVLGSREAAERWLAAPAIGLDRRRPIDLLQSSEGTELVRTLLTRMDYGVYT